MSLKNSMLTDAKKIFTKDLYGNSNGFLVEIKKQKNKTEVYLTVAYPKCFKGYHLHKIRESNYICIKGKIKIILYIKNEGKKEYILDSNNPQYLNIPTNIPTGILNEQDEEAWLINCPEPAYDPDLIDEQIDFTQKEVENWLYDK